MEISQIVIIIRQSGLKINYNLEEGSDEWKKTIGYIVEAIRMTYGLNYSSEDIVQGIVLDVIQEYKAVGHLLRTP